MQSDSDFEDPDKISKLTGNNNKRGSRRVLVRQQATAEIQDTEDTEGKEDTEEKVSDIPEVSSEEGGCQEVGAGRVIYTETIDISPGSPGSGRSTR